MCFGSAGVIHIACCWNCLFHFKETKLNVARLGINILEKNGSINKNGIKEFVGLDRFEARKLLTKRLK